MPTDGTCGIDCEQQTGPSFTVGPNAQKTSQKRSFDVWQQRATVDCGRLISAKLWRRCLLYLCPVLAQSVSLIFSSFSVDLIWSSMSNTPKCFVFPSRTRFLCASLKLKALEVHTLCLCSYFSQHWHSSLALLSHVFVVCSPLLCFGLSVVRQTLTVNRLTSPFPPRSQAPIPFCSFEAVFWTLNDCYFFFFSYFFGGCGCGGGICALWLGLFVLDSRLVVASAGVYLDGEERLHFWAVALVLAEKNK